MDALRRVQLKDNALKGWKKVTKDNQGLRKFQAGLVIFYYKYLTGKYFNQLKNARQFRIQMEHCFYMSTLKRRKRYLQRAFSGLKQAKQINKVEDRQVQIMAQTFVFKKFIKHAKEKTKIVTEHNRKLLMFKLTKMRIYRAAFFKNLQENQTQALKERTNKIKCDMFRRQKLQSKAFKVLKKIKYLKKKWYYLANKKAQQYSQYLQNKKLRKCFEVFEYKVWRKMVPYRIKLRKNVKHRCFHAILNIVKRKKELMYRYRNFERNKVQRLFQAMKDNRKESQRLRLNYNLICYNQKVRLRSQYFKNWTSKLTKIESAEVQFKKLKKKHDLKHKSVYLREWILNYREHKIKNVIRPLMAKKQFFNRAKSIWKEKKIAEQTEYKLDKYLRRKRLQNLFETLIENTVHVRKANFICNFMKDGKRKQLFHQWKAAAARRKELRTNGRKITGDNYRRVLHVWYKLLISKKWNEDRLMRKVKPWLQSYSQEFNQYREEVQQVKELAQQNLQKKFLQNFREAVEVSKFMDKQESIADNFYSKNLQKKFLKGIEESQKLSQDIEQEFAQKLKKRVFKKWGKKTAKKIDSKSKINKSLLFWYKNLLKKSFYGLNMHEQKMKRKWQNERRARKQFTLENNKKFLGLIISRARNLRADRLDLDLAEDQSDPLNVQQQAHLWKEGPGSKKWVGDILQLDNLDSDQVNLHPEKLKKLKKKLKYHVAKPQADRQKIEQIQKQEDMLKMFQAKLSSKYAPSVASRSANTQKLIKLAEVKSENLGQLNLPPHGQYQNFPQTEQRHFTQNTPSVNTNFSQKSINTQKSSKMTLVHELEFYLEKYRKSKEELALISKETPNYSKLSGRIQRLKHKIKDLYSQIN